MECHREEDLLSAHSPEAGNDIRDDVGSAVSDVHGT